jgi:phosphatidyl-myo-inositol alpha-mannosyltransferase
MRIAMVTEHAYPMVGGVAEHVHHLSRELVERGHEVRVVTGSPLGGGEALAALDEESAARNGYRTTRVGRLLPLRASSRSERLAVGPRLRSRVDRAVAGSDVVHVHGSAGPVLSLLALRDAARRPAASVGTFHTLVEGDGWGQRVFHGYVAGAVSALDRRIAISQACARGVERVFPGRYDVIPTGVDCRLFRPLLPHEGRPDGPPRILFVGRLEPRNGLGTLLRAAAILRAQGRRFALQVVGGGAARSRYERDSARLGLAGTVEFCGTLRDERARLFREATIFAAPVIRASFGVALVEALASGTPVVAADTPGFREVLSDAPGLLVPPDDPLALSGGLSRLLDDHPLRAQWSLAGRRVAERRYDWPPLTGRVEEVYGEALELHVGPGSPPPGADQGW